MTSKEVRNRFLAFFEKRGHAILPSASLVPENDPTVLFNTAGMQPLVPYLMGRPHPLGDKLANIQKCVRTGDIDDIGDNTHLTFFEMMGNWSLGSYFKEDAIKWSFELLTSKEEGFGLDPKRLYVTVFAGDENADRDEEAASIWESVGVPRHRIYFKDATANWWPAVKGKDTWTGPTGPCTEMFYDLTVEGLGDLTPEEYNQADEEQKLVEIWNDVFMEFEKKEGKIVRKLEKKNVDTGSGLERISAVLQKKSNVFDTDVFKPIMHVAKELTSDIRKQRIISDHIRTATFMIADGVIPANTDQGYVLRRIIRRMVFNTDSKTLSQTHIERLVTILTQNYGEFYPNIENNGAVIVAEIAKEAEKFTKALDQGMKEFEKISKENISGIDAFTLFSSYGFPVDLTIELAKAKGVSVDKDGFDLELKKHQDLSRVGSEKKFKGGLGGTSPMEVRFHTATHLLNAALRNILGDHVSQRGSNITPERLRFDFSHTDKLSPEQKTAVETLVNGWITQELDVTHEEMNKDVALESGATHAFGDKYGDVVTVYTIGPVNSPISKEFCGGPHVTNTRELGIFSILKEEAVASGVRRIKAVLK
ncbi:MAG TPA: alanine--tRNA ligase [Candidatus Paceibacterota bacterium]|nr:alanine--tRNA ligase [Candidatus Paceibacterota bacterium]